MEKNVKNAVIHHFTLLQKLSTIDATMLGDYEKVVTDLVLKAQTILEHIRLNQAPPVFLNENIVNDLKLELTSAKTKLAELQSNSTTDHSETIARIAHALETIASTYGKFSTFYDQFSPLIDSILTDVKTRAVREAL